MKTTEFLNRYLVDRHNSRCMKWDSLKSKYGREDLVSMWIADMEFKTPEPVIDAIVKRAQAGVFGYSNDWPEYYDALSNWMETRYNFPVKKEWVRFCTGCVTAIAWSIWAFTKPQDACLILTPVYYPFHNVVTYNDRKLVKVDLDYNDQNGHFTMNYEAIEKAIVENDVKLFIQCSPHNPAGRVWTEEELDTVLGICKKHGVIVVSDEIHQDFVIDETRKFIPAAVVKDGKYRDIVVTLNAASKTFNLAALIHSHIIITDEKLRAQYDLFARGMNRTELNVLAMEAVQAAYTHGDEWLDALLHVIRENLHYLKERLQKEVSNVIVTDLDGTYLVMLDLRPYIGTENVSDFVVNQCRLAVDYGEQFGDKYKGFIRLNLATDPALVKQAVDNLVAALQSKL
ncbi:MAG: pyridoxal phosphate-dependent aminotransferase [Veillonella sp.]|uniref:MalY/PatB family protein n=1 Tax=Veillonella sp. TaxID=1926307 RepID=UPI0025F7EDF5|nr:MalY/PatB family protein [Veillonella sp.]MBS4913079.1 pyridoxal phosphate-dependent aminotransferase [Veillonella sp.]